MYEILTSEEVFELGNRFNVRSEKTEHYMQKESEGSAITKQH